MSTGNQKQWDVIQKVPGVRSFTVVLCLTAVLCFVDQAGAGSLSLLLVLPYVAGWMEQEFIRSRNSRNKRKVRRHLHMKRLARSVADAINRLCLVQMMFTQLPRDRRKLHNPASLAILALTVTHLYIVVVGILAYAFPEGVLAWFGLFEPLVSTITLGHLEKCLCEIKVALLLYSGLMIFGLRSSLSV